MTLQYMFPDNSFDIMPFKPLAWDSFLRIVLLPETAIRLIQDDLGGDLSSATATLQRSRVFGTMIHPLDSASTQVEEIRRKITSVISRNEAYYRLWIYSKSTMGFNDWVLDQRAIGTRQRIKEEEVDSQMDTGKGRPVVNSATANVIDLTEDSDLEDETIRVITRDQEDEMTEEEMRIKQEEIELELQEEGGGDATAMVGRYLGPGVIADNGVIDLTQD